MKFTLKDYQDAAVGGVLINLRKARKRWHEDADRHAFALTAPTGAGKTVMAAAAFEALFHGDDNYDFDRDPGAVVIWFSDDPSLNEQTRFRLMEASDRIRHTDLKVVENTFNREKFEAGKIYFLNTQKLRPNSLLVRGFEPSVTGQVEIEMRPDARAYTIWDTIRNTIEDPSLTLYLVLDEAHRGMGNPTAAATAERATIVQRLINGDKGVPAIPVVLGISATVDRFSKAMEVRQDRILLSNVEVDAKKVQESGLLKDTLVLDIPDDGGGAFETILVRRAAAKLKESTELWARYAATQGMEPVIPLMVLQVPNKPDPKDVASWLEIIFQEYDDLPATCIANVFGDHATEQFGARFAPYIEPQLVQDQKWVRILIAKDAISTGWDCPRAEVMVSFRSAQDKTHITQLLGRMVRTPMARRIPGNDRLNSVDCLLPYFDRKAVQAVADTLMTGGTGGEPPLKRVLINPKDMLPNALVPQVVWDRFVGLPSQTRPQAGAKPAKRLTALALELASDGLLEGARASALSELHKALDAAQVRYAAEIAVKRDEVMTVEGQALEAHLGRRTMTFNQFHEAADMAVINEAFKRAGRAISPEVARTYEPVLAKRKDASEPPDEDAFMDARADIAALSLVPEVATYFDAEADALARKWLTDYRVAIKGLSDERREVYRQISEMSPDPQDIDLVKPTSWRENTAALEEGRATQIPTYKNHLMSGDDGLFPAELNTWEKEVLAKESTRPGFIAWYRNPSRSAQESLGIAYEDSEGFKIVRPDFLFFSKNADNSIAVDIVDPHGTQFADALPKLQGLAHYAATHRDVYRRIESVAVVDGKMRVLDLTNPRVREAIQAATDAQSAFGSSLAQEYR